MGPTPVSAARVASITPAQRRVLSAVTRSAEPVSITEIASEAEVHPNTVRLHLQQLIADGHITQQRRAPSGRGRPGFRYQAARPENPEPTGQQGRSASEPATPALDPGVAEYLALADAFAEHLSQSSPMPSNEARVVGRLWGRTLVGRSSGEPGGQSPASGGPADSPRDEAIDLLDRLGFSPHAGDRGETADDGLVLLRTCPLLAEAERYPEVICQVHRGLVEGALKGLGGVSEGVDLVPFAAPGACHLVIPRSADR